MSEIYWHIASVNGEGKPVLGHGDGREIRVGETLCEQGLHACSRLLDCLNYARGTVICKVTLGGTVVAMTTAEAGERILREFARWCALEVAHLWDMPDVVRRYLETGDEALRAAAWAAARDAARDASWAAARDAVWAASWAAVWAASWAAARATVWDASWDAAGDAFLDKAHAHLVALVEAEFAKEDNER